MKKKQNLLIGLVVSVLVGFGVYKINEKYKHIQQQNDPCYKDRPNNDTISIIIYKAQITNEDSTALVRMGLKKTLSCPCDSNLQLWGDTTRVSIYGHDGLAHTGDQKPHGGSVNKTRVKILEDAGFKVSPNYIVRTPDNSPSSAKKNIFLFPPTSTPQSNLIGVMDSGIKSNNIWSNPNDNDVNGIDNDGNGLVDDEHGWNFLNIGQQGSNNIYPDSTHPHGTMVTHLIERELQGYPNYKIVPMVVLDKNKEGRLFNLLCAMAYATKIPNLRTLNASLGYYGNKSDVLEIMIGKLKSTNIMLVTAAGNADPSDSCEVVNNRNPRDLASRKHKFYPAAYAYGKNSSHVIAATTVNKQIAPDQNYSNLYVDIGVMGDRGEWFNFQNSPGTSPQIEYDWGTSFAAPVVTAYSFIGQTRSPSLPIQKSNILVETVLIKTSNYSFYRQDPLKTYIKGGKTLVKNPSL